MGPIAPGGDNWFGFVLPPIFALFYIGFLVMVAVSGWLMWRDHEHRCRVYRYEFQDKTLDRSRPVPPLHHEEGDR